MATVVPMLEEWLAGQPEADLLPPDEAPELAEEEIVEEVAPPAEEVEVPVEVAVEEEELLPVAAEFAGKLIKIAESLDKKKQLEAADHVDQIIKRLLS